MRWADSGGWAIFNGKASSAMGGRGTRWRISGKTCEDQQNEGNGAMKKFGGIGGFLLLIILIIFSIAPLSVPILVYFSWFHDLDWLFALTAVLIWCVSGSIVYGIGGRGPFYEIAVGSAGWVALLSYVTNIWFFFSAIFFDGSWLQFFYSLIAGMIFKGAAYEYRAQQKRDNLLK